MYTVGIIVKDTQVSQLNWEIISQLNELNRETNNNHVLFYMNATPLCVNNFHAIMNAHDINKVKQGILIATDLDSASFLIKSNTLSRKILYVWNLEWIHNKNLNYLQTYSIMHNIELWTRSQLYANIISNQFGVTPEVSEKFNIKRIMNVYR